MAKSKAKHKGKKPEQKLMKNGRVRPEGFGGAQKRGGGIPYAMKMKASESIMKIIGGDKGYEALIKKIYTQAKKGAFRQQELLLNYILGKPTDRIKIEAANGASVNVGKPIIQIVADNLRLEKLNKDIVEKDGAPKEIPAERIAEMESVLTEAVEHQEQTINTQKNGTQEKERRDRNHRAKRKVD